MKRYLKYLRIIVSVFCLAAMTATGAGTSSALLEAAGLIERVQFIPLVLSMSVGMIVLWLGLTFLFGRIYCSTVCPVGTVQDIFIRLPRLTRKMASERPFRYAAPMSTMRYTLLVVVLASLLAGITAVACVLDPAEIYLRLVDLAGATVAVTAVTLVTVALIAWMSAKRGRLWCNTICPVGTALGAVSRFSLFHFDIDTDLCTNCRRCADVCKAECINLDDHVVDGSRCVNCFDCIAVCRDKAIDYTTRRHQLSIPMMQRLKQQNNPETALDAEAGVISNFSSIKSIKTNENQICDRASDDDIRHVGQRADRR